MESSGVPGCVHASETAHALLQDDGEWVPRGTMEVGGAAGERVCVLGVVGGGGVVGGEGVVGGWGVDVGGGGDEQKGQDSGPVSTCSCSVGVAVGAEAFDRTCNYCGSGWTRMTRAHPLAFHLPR